MYGIWLLTHTSTIRSWLTQLQLWWWSCISYASTSLLSQGSQQGSLDTGAVRVSKSYATSFKKRKSQHARLMPDEEECLNIESTQKCLIESIPTLDRTALYYSAVLILTSLDHRLTASLSLSPLRFTSTGIYINPSLDAFVHKKKEPQKSAQECAKSGQAPVPVWCTTQGIASPSSNSVALPPFRFTSTKILINLSLNVFVRSHQKKSTGARKCRCVI
jgi:hypothetical protein